MLSRVSGEMPPGNYTQEDFPPGILPSPGLGLETVHSNNKAGDHFPLSNISGSNSSRGNSHRPVQQYTGCCSENTYPVHDLLFFCYIFLSLQEIVAFD